MRPDGSPFDRLICDGPVFAFTADLDWASESCIETLLDRFAERDVVPTLFVTHDSPACRGAAAAGRAHLALHPNFLPGSSHGVSPEEVVAHVARFAPEARGSRSHAYADSTPIARALAAHGLIYDSSPMLALQPHLRPLRHWTGLVRLPVFWEDDVHWLTENSWDFTLFRDAFVSPGLKVVDVHPFIQMLNIPDEAFYLRVKPLIGSLGRETARPLRHDGAGAATFLDALLDLAQAYPVTTLESLTAGNGP